MTNHHEQEKKHNLVKLNSFQLLNSFTISVDSETISELQNITLVVIYHQQ